MSMTLSPLASPRTQVSRIGSGLKVRVAAVDPGLPQSPSSTTSLTTTSPAPVPLTLTVSPLAEPTISPGPDEMLQVRLPADEPAEPSTTVEPNSYGLPGGATMTATSAGSSQTTEKVICAEAVSSQKPSLTVSFTVTSPPPVSLRSGLTPVADRSCAGPDTTSQL